MDLQNKSNAKALGSMQSKFMYETMRLEREKNRIEKENE